MIGPEAPGTQCHSSRFGAGTRFLIVALAMGLGVLCVKGAHGRGFDAGTSTKPPVAKPSAANELEPVPVPAPTAEAMQYYYSGNWLWLINRLWALLIPGIFAFSGASARLRDLAKRLGRNWFLTIGIYILLFLPILFIVDLPLSFYQGFIRQHAYGLSNQTLARWFGNALKSLAIDMAAGFAFLWIPYLLLARSPKRWWLYTAILSVPFLFVTVLVDPIWIDPLFNKFGPMKNQALERSILDLAQRAGIEGSRVFEVDKSADTNALNAYVKGILQSKRIVLWDTMIAKLEEPELLVVMGHEMGHYVLGHVARSIWLSTIITLTGLFLIDRIGRWLVARYRNRLGFDSLADIASVPLLMMLLEGAYVVLSPVALAYSRYQEHEADRYALNLTHANHSGATAFVKMQMENLSNPRPGRLYQIFRSTHPSIGDRIDFCNTYHPWRSEAASTRRE